MIDEFSRFSNAVVIRDKSPPFIGRNVLKFWVSISGAPKKVFSDFQEQIQQKMNKVWILLVVL